METIIFAVLGSSVLSALVSQLGAYLLNRRERKDTKEDNDDTIAKSLQRIEDKLDIHIKQDEAQWADHSRTQILRFGDELKQKALHTEEHFNQVLETIDSYEHYCEKHPEYPNTKAVSTIAYIKAVYKEMLTKNEFI